MRREGEEEEEEEEFVMATKRLKSNKSACLHFVQSAALTKVVIESNLFG